MNHTALMSRGTRTAGANHPGDVLFRNLPYGLAVDVARGWDLDPRDAADVFDGMSADEDRWSVLCWARDRLAVQRRWHGPKVAS